MSSEQNPQYVWSGARRIGRGLVRGELSLTKTHVVFEPKGLAARAEGTRFSVPLTFVAAVGVAPGTGGFFSGGRTPQLCLTLGDGSEWFFLVNDMSEATEAVRARLEKKKS